MSVLPNEIKINVVSMLNFRRVLRQIKKVLCHRLFILISLQEHFILMIASQKSHFLYHNKSSIIFQDLYLSLKRKLLIHKAKP